MKITVIAGAAMLLLGAATSGGFAADVVPAIKVSPEEGAKAREAFNNFRQAYNRWNRATSAWNVACENFQASHPEMPGLVFTADFSKAFVKRATTTPGLVEAATIELSGVERQKLEPAHRELQEAAQALNEAEKNWSNFQSTFVSTHDLAHPGDGSTPWRSGVVFNTDFSYAMPR